MKPGSVRHTLVIFVFSAGLLFLASCAVDENAALQVGGESPAATDSSAEGEAPSWAELMERARERRAARASEEAEEEAPVAADATPEEKEKTRAPWQRTPEEREEARAREEAARKKAEELAEKRRAEREAAREERRERLAERRAQQEEEEAEAAGDEEVEVASTERRTRRSGFAGLFNNSSREFQSEGHYIQVNQRVVDQLSPSNAKIEIDLSDQRARIYKEGAGGRELAIETQVSTGRAGYTTPTGTWRIKEKKVEKRSTIYGRWVNSSGATVASNGNSRYRPSGGARFIGAEMPYWMRVNGGIGMHVGYVPNHPASHGCIRVPASVQPLIFSKVGVGTSVTVRH